VGTSIEGSVLEVCGFPIAVGALSPSLHGGQVGGRIGESHPVDCRTRPACEEKASVLSFTMDGFRTGEVGDYLNRKGIAVRGGHHCAQPMLRRFGLESTVRATFALYDTCEEIDRLIADLWDLRSGRQSRRALPMGLKWSGGK